MKKLTVTLAVTLVAASMAGMTAHAADDLDKDYIVSEIWSDLWNGKPDDGTTYPESSYKYHLLTKWVDDNYGDDDYNWSDVGELTYDYKDYYRDYIKGFDFEDDNSGNWTIDTEDNHYSFYMLNGMWQMIDRNGDTVDTFPPHDTLAEVEDEGEPAQGRSRDNGGQSGNIKVAGGTESHTEGDTDEDTEDTAEVAETSQTASQTATEGSSNTTLYAMIGLAVVATIIIGILVMRKRK